MIQISDGKLTISTKHRDWISWVILFIAIMLAPFFKTRIGAIDVIIIFIIGYFSSKLIVLKKTKDGMSEVVNDLTKHLEENGATLTPSK